LAGVKRMGKSLRAGLYARVSTHDQHTLSLQLAALRTYAAQRGWSIVTEVQEVGSGAIQRPKRELLMQAARRRDVDAVLVWRLDRWGRSVADLLLTLQELNQLGVGVVSLTEALDLTTPTGRAMAGLLAVFAEFEREILRERGRAGIAHARQHGKPHGRPPAARRKAPQVHQLFADGLSQSAIARQLDIGRTSVRRILADRRRPP
jgi:putative DNA-invertase from lambdoid prophage Rac